MRLDDLHRLKRAVPFRPFRLVTACGRAYDIHHPNHLWPGDPRTLIGIPADLAKPETCATWVSVATADVLRAEFPESAGG